MRYLSVILALVSSGCLLFKTPEQRYLDAANIHRYKAADPRSLSSGPFLLEIGDVYTGAEETNLFIEVVLRNTSEAEANFDSSNLEVLDDASGLSYYSFARDKTTIGNGGSDYISTLRVGSKRAVEGRLFFITPMKKATGKKYQLRSGDSTITLEHVKRLTAEDAPPKKDSNGR